MIFLSSTERQKHLKEWIRDLLRGEHETYEKSDAAKELLGNFLKGLLLNTNFLPFSNLYKSIIDRT